MLTGNYSAQARLASGINVVLGVWLLVSPWVFGYHVVGSEAIANSVIVGALIAILAALRAYSGVYPGLSWINLLLALWTVVSPWVCGYAENISGRLDNMLLGIVIAGLAGWSGGASTAGRRYHPPTAAAR